MDRIMMMTTLIDFEIDKLVSEKKQIDIRLTELYEIREDLVVEYEKQVQDTCTRCKE